MKIEIVKCDNCDESTEDIHKKTGWITFENFKVSISAGRKSGVGDPHTLRYFNKENEVHFCSLWCLIQHLYKNKRNFNSDKIHNIEDFFKHMAVGSNDEDEINQIYKEVDSCLRILY